jgi:truncated hemoglobin YjbI
MRHAPFVISEAERDAWLRHMAAALDAWSSSADVHPPIEAGCSTTSEWPPTG